jgi:acetyltransferase
MTNLTRPARLWAPYSCKLRRMDIQIVRLTAAQAEQRLPELAALLQDAVNGGAAVGFLPPLPLAEAAAYWREVVSALGGAGRILLVAIQEGALVGTVQLDPAMRPNGLHRAEVTKVLVHSAHRRQGVGRALMLAVEAEAARAGRTTLVLDTRLADAGEPLYASLGYQRAGIIPEYARSADGTLHATVVMYKLLGS